MHVKNVDLSTVRSCGIHLKASSLADLNISISKTGLKITFLNHMQISQGLMSCKHVDSWRCHQMKTFSALLAICAGNSQVTGEFPAQRPVTRSFGIIFDLHLSNGWVNNRGAGDLRRHRAHYDITNAVCLNQAEGGQNVSICLIFIIWLKLHWGFIQMVQLILSPHWFE